MFLPHTKIEKMLWQENSKRLIFGVDEAGRGPLAGPVVAGAGWINPKVIDEEFKGRELVRDSKTLSAKQRESIFKIINESENFQFGIGVVSNTVIDRINILSATFLAMRLAVDDLMEKTEKNKLQTDDNAQEMDVILLIDGNKKIPKIKTSQRIFPGGDRNVFSISVASICAKVWRDRLMDKYHKKYPLYGFDRHRGYGTKFHYEMIKKHGACQIHRESFNLGL
jgi:ribonuclease HII